MSRPEPALESQQPLVDKKSKKGFPDSGGGGGGGNSDSNGTNGFSHGPASSRDLDGDDPQNLKNHQQAQAAKLAKLRICLYVLAGITIVGFIILITLVAVFFTILHSEVAHHTHKPKLGTQMAAILEEGVCVSCEDFRLSANAEEEAMLNKYIDESSEQGGTVRCCVDKPGELLDLLKQFIKRRFRLELAKGTVGAPWPQAGSGTGNAVSVERPAAHLIIGRQDLSLVKNVPGRQQMINKWLYQGDMTLLAGGVVYDEGRIVVPADGYYYVYSQISFLEAYGGGRNQGSPSLSVYLYRYNILYDKGGEEKLAQNSITKCQSQASTHGEYVSSLGAVFSLRRQDHILVKVTNVTIIAPEPKSSFFGLFKI